MCFCFLNKHTQISKHRDPSHLQAAVGHRNLGAVVLNKGCNIWWLHVAWVAGQRLHPQIQIRLHPKNDSKVIVLRVWQSTSWIFQLWVFNGGSGYLIICLTNHIVSNIFADYQWGSKSRSAPIMALAQNEVYTVPQTMASLMWNIIIHFNSGMPPVSETPKNNWWWYLLYQK